MTALTEAQAALAELRLTDVFKTTKLPAGDKHHRTQAQYDATHVGLAEKHVRNVIGLLQPAPDPVPSPTRPAWPHGGVAFWATGAPVPSGSERYDIGIVANWQPEGGQKNLAGLPLLYTSGARCSTKTDGRWYGMTPAELQAGGWAALDKNGQPIVEQTFSGMIADIGNPAYALKWAKNVEGWLVKFGYRGVQIDDVDGALHELELSANETAAFPTDQAFRDAQVKFHQVAAHYLRSRGYYVLSNVSGDDGYKLSIAALVDGVMIEYFDAGAAGTAKKILQAGCDAVGLVKGGSSDPLQARKAMEALGDPRGVTMVDAADYPWGPWAQ